MCPSDSEVSRIILATVQGDKKRLYSGLHQFYQCPGIGAGLLQSNRCSATAITLFPLI